MFWKEGSDPKQLRNDNAAAKTAALSVVLLILVCYFPMVCSAAATEVVWGDDDDNPIHMQDGGSYAVPLHISKKTIIISIENGFGYSGLLYYVPDESNPTSRNFIAEVRGYRGVRSISWEKPGTYAIDVYEIPPPVLGGSYIRTLFSLFGISVAEAQTSGYVETIQFRIMDQDAVPQCCSSILFLPGMEASRLYMQTPMGERKLWEPGLFSLQSDARALYLNPDGTTINSVYTKTDAAIDLVDVPLANATIYKSFLNQLATLKASSTIQDFSVFPYDWRMSPRDIVEDGTPYDDGIHFPSDVVQALASHSKTGKVTIVGHSNGGLVAKALMQWLEREGHANLVDKVIFVDSPLTGTPKTIASLLHGDFQNFPGWGGFIVSKATARALGENMPDGYALLPSDAYFASVATPVVDLTNAPGLRVRSGISTPTISNSADLQKFLTGNGRTKPSGTDIETPDVLSPTLLADAANLHQSIDSWSPPPGVQVIQIAGWGLDTPSGVTYTEKRVAFCQALTCTFATTTQHRVEMTEDGDETVVVPSEVNTGGVSYFINIKDYNNSFKTRFSHADVTGMPVFRTLFEILVSSTSDNVLPEFITRTKPSVGSDDRRLRLRVLSPVTLDAYDSQGRHTGMATNPNSSSDLYYKEEQIPNSYYEEFGEGKYLGLPSEDSYQIKLHGLDTGTFTFEITPVSGGISGQPVSFSDIPVTASSTVTVQVNGISPASTTLAVDENGDGKIDIAVASSSQLTDPLVYTKLIGITILTMDLGPIVKIQLIAKFINVGYLIVRSTQWNSDDGDLKDVSKDSLRTRIIRKLNLIESYIQTEVEKPPVKRLKSEWISAAQGTQLLAMLEKLKVLVSEKL
jgi:pimeloyl-ACP methyl ester carboxylesterase